MATIQDVEAVENMAHTLGRMDKLRTEREFNDIIVKVDTTEYPCQRAVLASISEYFYRLFTTDLRDESSRETTLKNISAETFEIVLKYAYSGVLNITKDNAFVLLKAGDFLEMDKFLQRCVDYIKRNRFVWYIFDIYLYAIHPLNNPDFASSVARNMVPKFEKIVKMDKFLKLPFDILKKMIEEMKKVPSKNKKCSLCNDGWTVGDSQLGYCCKCTVHGSVKPVSSMDRDHVFESMIKWLNHDLINRKTHLRELALQVEMPEKYIRGWEATLNQYEHLFKMAHDDSEASSFTQNRESSQLG